MCMARKRVKDVNIRFTGVPTLVHVTIPKTIHKLIKELVIEKKYKSIAGFLKESAELGAHLFYETPVKGADLNAFINTLVKNGEFASVSQFFDWVARWKLIQLHHYPNIDRIGYALRNWFGGAIA